ncbi:MAG: aldo/keto reductase [Alphaproteobacteria bacterium]|nr:aldo/keto reductase [Alphaproteobacteria bacterium]
MRYNRLGKSDLVVSELSLGTMTYGEQNTEAEAHEQLDYAWDHGVNFLDTAEMYAVPTRAETQGLSERYVGSWMKRRGRDKVIVAGKVTSTSPKKWIPPNRTPAQPPAITRLDRASIVGAVEGSLRRLQTDYIDLIELHWPERYIGTLFGAYKYERQKEQTDVVPFDEQVDALHGLVKQGKIRAWGLSNETTYGVCMFADAAKRLGAPPPATIQNDFSLVDRSFEPELAEACAPRHLDIALLVYGALCGGTLAGKYLDGDPPGARHTRWPTFQPRYHSPITRWAAKAYVEIARSHGLLPSHLALAWVVSREYVSSTILGATTMPQLKECMAVLDVKLGPDVLEAIEQQHMRCPNPNKAARAISPGFVKDVRQGV